LRLEVAGLAAIDAVVEAILAEAHIVLALAKVAPPIALAAGLFLLAIEADKFLSHVLLSNDSLVICRSLWQQL
jgi:hypothetical protein